MWQVHVMVTSAGHDPGLTRTLQEAAEALSGLHAVHSPSLSPLLPEVVKLEKQDAAVEPAAVRILGGSLASNNKGQLFVGVVVTALCKLAPIGMYSTAKDDFLVFCVPCLLLTFLLEHLPFSVHYILTGHLCNSTCSQVPVPPSGMCPVLLYE